jgi:hypothetical protein
MGEDHSNGDRHLGMRTGGISTVARTGDIVEIIIPLLNSADKIASILAALEPGAKLIDHYADDDASTDLSLVFRLRESRPSTDRASTDQCEP